jgi:tetratricopeptide (TPR) repeat protein
MWYDRNWEEADLQAKRALELEPNNAAAMFLLENLYSFLGRHEEAIEIGKKACELDPSSLVFNSIEAQTLLYAGNVEEALQQALTAHDLDDNFWHVHLILARIYAQKGMYPEAIAEADRAAQLSGDHSYDLAVKGYALARSGRELDARAIIDELLKRARNARHNTNVALVYTGLRDKEKAMDHLERGFEDHELQHELRSAPAWDELRQEPRFTELMRKLRLE